MRPLSLVSIVALAGCFGTPDARRLAALQPPGAANPPFGFTPAEVVAGSGLRRTQGAISPGQLISLVYQADAPGEELESTYCTTIGLIKVAMLQFGVDGVARSVQGDPADPGGLIVTLRNGDRITIAPWQRKMIAQSITLGRFAATPPEALVEPLVQWFQLYFAVAVARLAAIAPPAPVGLPQVDCVGAHGADPDLDRRLYRAAMSALTNGLTVRHAPALLGLIGVEQELLPGSTPAAALAWTRRHVMFAASTGGAGESDNIVDRWGQARRVGHASVQYLQLREVGAAPGDLEASQLAGGASPPDWDPDLSPQGSVCRAPGTAQSIAAPARVRRVQLVGAAGLGTFQFHTDADRDPMAVFAVGIEPSVALTRHLAVGGAFSYQSRLAPDDPAGGAAVQASEQFIVDLFAAVPLQIARWGGDGSGLSVVPRIGPTLVYSHRVSRTTPARLDPTGYVSDASTPYDGASFGFVGGVSLDARHEHAVLGLDAVTRAAWPAVGSPGLASLWGFALLFRAGFDFNL